MPSPIPATLQPILQYLIDHATTAMRTILVGVDGGSGSGKSTFADWLKHGLIAAEIPVALVHTDDFFLPSARRANSHFPLAEVADLEWIRLRDQVIYPLRLGNPAHYQVYNWETDSLQDWVTIYRGGVTIVEGVTATRSKLAIYYDLRIWFNCPRAVREERLRQRGDISAEEIEHWMPSEEAFFGTDSVDRRAHLVMDSAEEGYIMKKWSPPGEK
ncbi:MAG: uridine kinase [Anaerolineaceae bacterium]|nr:uridine kinase [Anaerolineaceae bacterium]